VTRSNDTDKIRQETG